MPDGYLGPTTSSVFYVVMLPIWTVASKIVKKTLKAKQVPMMAIGAAFSFVFITLPV
ncbi:MAG: energy-coupling factor ABC transporter permease [Candidatus Desantisbacteria bacterium]